MARVLLSPFLEASFSISLPPFLFPGDCPHSLPPKYTHFIRSQGMDERTCRYCLSVPRSPYIIQYSDSTHFPTNFINFSLRWKKKSHCLYVPRFHYPLVCKDHVFMWYQLFSFESLCVCVYTIYHNLISPPFSPAPTHFPLPSPVFLPTSSLKQLTNSVQLVLCICALGEGYQLGHWQSANGQWLSILSLRVPLTPQLRSGIRSPSASILEFLTLLIKLVSFHKTSS